MEDNKKAAIEKIYLLTKQDVEFNDELRKSVTAFFTKIA